MPTLERSVRVCVGLLTLTLIGATPAVAAESPTVPPPEFTEVTVHDPSIVTSGDDIWVFGSHAASAYTSDLIQWQQHTVDLGITRNNSLFEDVDVELAETFEWAESTALWAPDVIQLQDGRFYMYYNSCRGDSPRSAMGVAVADSVEGPYKDQGIILRSGQRPGEPQQIPGEDYDATIHPNAVDPDVFYDAEGNLWMVYGSYSGGIFILELDQETGMPLEGQGWGTHLIGGDHARIEGPSIRYDAETGYYYLYLSFGGLDAHGGYDIRVMRSASPDGPYVDAQGQDMSAVSGAPGTIFDDVSIQPFGVKLMGGHRWLSDPTDPSEGLGAGYVSPGHNSWYDDPVTGESFLVFHTRFPERGEIHNVRVHQMWMNKDGWPVVSPLRYGAETAGPVASSDITGSWQLINMGKDITHQPATAQVAEFHEDGTVDGGVTGTWTLTGDSAATVSLDGSTYTGHFVPTWDPDLETWSTSLSVVDDRGVTVWGRGEAAQGFPPAAPVEFVDVEGSEHANAILWLAERGIANGWTTPAGQEFRPLNSITREAMAAFLYRYAGEPEVTVPEESPFLDVAPEHTEFYEEIIWLYNEGITNGWDTATGTQFRPMRPITRDAIAAFLYRLAEEPEWDDPQASPFVDITSTNTEFYSEITWLADAGITQGWSTVEGQKFLPLRATTRDAMATFLHRLDGQLVD